MSQASPESVVSQGISSEERVFNDDLLINTGDLHYAKSQFPRVFPILDHQELRAIFGEYEKTANAAHKYVHWLGALSISFGSIALLSAATEPLWANWQYADRVTIAFEFFGLAAALIAGGSLWLGPWRRRWLESRFMTERLRQWHFQILVRRGDEVDRALAESTPSAIEGFRAEREKWFDAFLQEHVSRLGSRMESLTGDSGVPNDWLHDPPTSYDAASSVFDDVVEVYRRLRFKHQYDYSTYKLSTSIDQVPWKFFQWPILRQQSAIQGAVSFCFITAFLCAIAVIVSRYFHLAPAIDPYFGSATLVIAIIGVALRTIQEGLGIAKDIERYRDYRGKVSRLLLCFEETTDRAKKLRLMEEMELAVVDELRGFLRAHRDAAFAL
jgi:hypothetical protein